MQQICCYDNHIALAVFCLLALGELRFWKYVCEDWQVIYDRIIYNYGFVCVHVPNSPKQDLGTVLARQKMALMLTKVSCLSFTTYNIKIIILIIIVLKRLVMKEERHMQQMKAANVAVAFVVLPVLCLLTVGSFKFWKFDSSGDQQGNLRQDIVNYFRLIVI